jgi:hypothetical protein
VSDGMGTMSSIFRMLEIVHKLCQAQPVGLDRDTNEVCL